MSKNKLTKIYAENQITGNKKWFTEAVWNRLPSRNHNGKIYPRQGFVQVNKKGKSADVPEAAKKVPKLTNQGLESIREKLISDDTKGLSAINHLIPFAIQTKVPIKNPGDLPSHELAEKLTEFLKSEEKKDDEGKEEKKPAAKKTAKK